METAGGILRPEAEIPRLSPRDVADKLERGEPILFLDARNAAAWSSALSQLPGALRMPPGQVDERARGIAQGLAMVVYCATPLQSDSAQVARRLRQLGFEEVSLLDGGYVAWLEGGFPLEPKGGMTELHQPMF